MFKTLVLSALLVAVVVAAPHHSSAVWSHEQAVPVVYQSAIAAHDVEVVVAAAPEPEYAQVGSVVSHVPTAVSHQSRTDYHSKPVVKSILAPVEIVQPVVHHQAPAATHLVYSAPVAHHQVYAQQPLVYSSSPVLYAGHQQVVQAW